MLCLPLLLLCLPLLLLACKPEPDGEADSGERGPVASSWTSMGCDVDGIYPWEAIELEAGPQPWMLTAWMLDGEVWVEEGAPRLVPEYEVVQVFWSYQPEPDECGLWVQSLG